MAANLQSGVTDQMIDDALDCESDRWQCSRCEHSDVEHELVEDGDSMVLLGGCTLCACAMFV